MGGRATGGRLLRGLPLAAWFVALAAPASARASLHVIPFPGTPDASPASEIIFSSLDRRQLRAVSADGSASGVHAGRVIALPDGAGTAFVPNHAFTPGERVSVTASLSSRAAGTAAGAPGSTRVSFSFTVRQPVGQEQALASAALAGRPSGSGRRTMHFRSQQDFHPPAVTVTSDPDTTSGDIFLTPHNAFQNGPMILNDRGQLVWFRPLSHMAAFNLEVQHYHGQPVLTWWQGKLARGAGEGTDVILSHAYRRVAMVHAGNGYASDFHEFQITRQGRALIDAYVPVRTNLSSVGGSSSGTAWDCVIQELDVRTGRVLWEWHALGHVPLTDSYQKVHGSRPFDFFHLNSIQQLPDGSLLVSARNTWAVYKINRLTGHVMWTLGGRHSSFHVGKGARFEWQHDAHLRGHTLTVFDDAAMPEEERFSSAKKLRVDIPARRAVLLHRYVHRPPLVAGAMGSAELLPNGNMFVGWGAANNFSEYTASGRQVFNGGFLGGVNSYRAYRFHWQANPATRPALAVAPQGNGALKLFASWNGATRVAAWRVLGGAGRRALGRFGTSPDTGFESELELRDQPHLLAVQALDAKGHVLGTSSAHAEPAHVAVFAGPAFVRTADGYGQVAAGCFTGHPCRLSVAISSAHHVLVRSGRRRVRSGRWALIPFRLGPVARRELKRSPSHRLSGWSTVRDSSSRASAGAPVVLIPYSTSGQGPARGASHSPTIDLLSTTGFVSSSGIGEILAACYISSRPCQARVTITSDGIVIGTSTPQRLGAGEPGEVVFELNQVGRDMLKTATGNQLPAQITLTDGRDSVRGEIALVRYR